MKKDKIFKLMLIILGTLSYLGIVRIGSQASVITPIINGQAAIVVDAQSGQILAAKNINTPLAAASTSKLLTAYLVNQAIAQGQLEWQTPVKISTTVAKVSQNHELTNVSLIAGRTYTVKKLYQAALLGSANGAAMALGEAVSGSSAKFVAKMHQQLTLWGIKDATVNNAAGLLNSQALDDAVGQQSDLENMWSVKTMAIIATHLLNDYPDILQTTKLRTIDFDKQSVKTTDMLLPGEAVTSKYQFDGLKTGTSNKAHQNFVGTLMYQHRRLITVVYGTGPVDGQNPTRFLETIKLLDQTLAQLKLTTIAPQKLRLPITVTDATTKQVKITNQQAITLWWQQNQTPPKFTVQLKSNLAAPLTKGQPVATIMLKHGDFLSEHDRNVGVGVTQQKVNAQGFFAKLWATILSWF